MRRRPRRCGAREAGRTTRATGLTCARAVRSSTSCPIAERWSAALPTTVRPDALIERFPRIANLLALQWSDANARAAYFDELLVDRRGHRQGFPPPVLDELLRLRNHSFGTNAG